MKTGALIRAGMILFTGLATEGRGDTLLDDFEDGDFTSKNYCFWSGDAGDANNDGQVLVFENAPAADPGSRLPNRAAHVQVRTGSGSWHRAQIKLTLTTYWTQPLAKLKPYVDYGWDLRAYQGIRFRAKSSGSYMCKFVPVAHVIPNYNYYSGTVGPLSSNWSEFVILFPQLTSAQTAVTFLQSLQHTDALTFEIYPPAGAIADLWLDDVELVAAPLRLPPVLAEAPSGLKEAAEARGLRVGFAAEYYHLADEQRKTALDRNAHFVIPAYGINMCVIQPSPGQWDFTAPDSVVKWAYDHGKKVKGHQLLMDADTPDWLLKGDYTSAEVDAILKEFIHRTIAHYRTTYPNTVTSWCVVNEGIDGATGSYRKTFWYNKLGEQYIDKAFHYAREADPSGKLYYSDYAIEWKNVKSDGLYSLIRRWLDRGVPIDAIGFQTHVSLAKSQFPGEAAVLDNFNRFGKLGLDVYVTEMDVCINDDLTGRTSAKLDQQAEIFRQVVAACLECPYCWEFCCWDITDKYSAAPNMTGHDDWPCLLDEWYQPKPAWYAVLEELTGHQSLPSAAAPAAEAEGFESGDFSQLSWESAGDTAWQVTSDWAHSGSYSAQAGAIDDGQSSTLTLTRTCQSGEISFYVRTSCEAEFDKLVFRMDGETLGEWSGYTEWEQADYPVSAGTHTFEWSYVKDATDSKGEDTVWLEDVVLP